MAETISLFTTFFTGSSSINCSDDWDTVGECPSVTAVTTSRGLVSGSWRGELALEFSRDDEPLVWL